MATKGRTLSLVALAISLLAVASAGAADRRKHDGARQQPGARARAAAANAAGTAANAPARPANTAAPVADPGRIDFGFGPSGPSAGAANPPAAIPRATDRLDFGFGPPPEPPPTPAPAVRSAPPVAARAASASAFSAPPPVESTVDVDDDSIVLNFENADIREVIYSLAVAMNINYWLDPRVQGQVTVRTTGRLSRDDLSPIFHQLLRNNGFSAVRSGDLYSIVPAEDAKTKLIRPGRRESDADQFVMNVVKVRHVSADQMAQTVTPFVSPGGDALPFPRSNLVIITDIAANADRLAELVRTFDTNTFAALNAKIFKIQYAVLEDLAAELQSILEAYHAAETGSPAALIPLARLGAIAVIAHDPTVVMAVEYWVSVLDVEAEAGGRRQVYVYRVENSKAVDLAAVLSQVYGEGGGTGTSRRARSGDAAEAGLGLGGGLASSRSSSGSGLGSSRRSNRSSSLDSDSGSGLGGGSGGLGSGGRSRSSRSSSRSGGSSVSGGSGGVVLGGADSQSEIFEQEVRVVEDEVTNSLVVLATPRDYQTLRTVLRDLDVVPRQVLIEAMIAEVSLTEGESLSFLQSLNGSNSDTGGKTGDQGGTYFDLFGRELRLIGTLGSGGILGTFSHYRNGIEVYRGVIDAAQSRGKVKVLSRPHLMTTDNQEARILVGQEVPIITSQADTDVTTSGQTRFLQNVQYRDTGIIVSVLPQVNSEGLVNLELSQEVSEIASTSSQGGIQSPTFTTREAETTVVVNSGETVVIGGIISDTKNEDREGVPYLMDVPVLGRLFRSDLKSRRRTELIIMITPFVVRDREEAEAVTEDFKRRVDRVLEDVELHQVEDPSSHTLVLEASSVELEAPPPAAPAHAPVAPPDGGPIPLDFGATGR